jgi:hypothetical protein
MTPHQAADRTLRKFLENGGSAAAAAHFADLLPFKSSNCVDCEKQKVDLG